MKVVIFLVAIFAGGRCDPIASMEAALGQVPERSRQTAAIAVSTQDFANSVIDHKKALEFRQKFEEVATLRSRIDGEINQVDQLSDQIGGQLQVLIQKKSQEEQRVQSLENQVNGLNGEIGANNANLAALHNELNNANNQLADAERKVRQSERKRRGFRGLINRLLGRYRRQVRERRRFRDTVQRQRNAKIAQIRETEGRRDSLVGQLNEARNQLALTVQSINRINAVTGRAFTSKEDLVKMRLFLGRLAPHMEQINKNMEFVEVLEDGVPKVFVKILNNSQEMLKEFLVAENDLIEQFKRA